MCIYIHVYIYIIYIYIYIHNTYIYSYIQITYKRCESATVTSLYCLRFSKLKSKDLKQILRSATNVVLELTFLWNSEFAFP